jgi:hypothetical protein
LPAGNQIASDEAFRLMHCVPRVTALSAAASALGMASPS